MIITPMYGPDHLKAIREKCCGDPFVPDWLLRAVHGRVKEDRARLLALVRKEKGNKMQDEYWHDTFKRFREETRPDAVPANPPDLFNWLEQNYEPPKRRLTGWDLAEKVVSDGVSGTVFNLKVVFRILRDNFKAPERRGEK